MLKMMQASKSAMITEGIRCAIECAHFEVLEVLRILEAFLTEAVDQALVT